MVLFDNFVCLCNCFLQGGFVNFLILLQPEVLFIFLKCWVFDLSARSLLVFEVLLGIWKPKRISTI